LQVLQTCLTHFWKSVSLLKNIFTLFWVPLPFDLILEQKKNHSANIVASLASVGKWCPIPLNASKFGKCYKFGELVKYFWENIMVIILNILVILLKILRGGQNDDWQNVKSWKKIRTWKRRSECQKSKRSELWQTDQNVKSDLWHLAFLTWRNLTWPNLT